VAACAQAVLQARARAASAGSAVRRWCVCVRAQQVKRQKSGAAGRGARKGARTGEREREWRSSFYKYMSQR